ncbi:MAG: polymer-forming cytoskeletal protein [bacterium]|nr:polymer-forming cytoskeletal protein [bacterium]
MFLGRDKPAASSPAQQPTSTSSIPKSNSAGVTTSSMQKEYSPMAEKNITIIAQGSSFKGTLKSESSVQIDGDFEGDIVVKDTVTIGAQAAIKANITAGEVKISGKVVGNVIAKDRLEIQSQGKMFGDIKTPRLIIAEGVVFEGHCSMGKSEEPAAEPQKKPAESAGGGSLLSSGSKPA